MNLIFGSVNMKRAPTLKDIAQQLGLSIATVSRALQDSYEIGEATKKRVLQLAKELNYQPNPYASSLRRRVSKTIAVVLPEVADSFFSLAINGIESVALEKGYHVLIYLTHESLQREKAILAEFKSGRVDGILISVSEETATGGHIREIMEAGIPVVFFDRVCEEIDTSQVVTNDYACGKQAALHLAEQGCRRVAYLCTSPALHISKKRMDGYREGLKEAGIHFRDADIVVCSSSLSGNTKLVEIMLRRKGRPDGFIASVEKLTTPVYLSCQKLGLRIPDDVRLLSFTNLQAALILQPPLTTITQPAFDMGAVAARQLFNNLDKKKRFHSNERIVIDSTLNPRGSTVRS